MYKKLQKKLTSEELLPSLWDKCKVHILQLDITGDHRVGGGFVREYKALDVVFNMEI